MKIGFRILLFSIGVALALSAAFLPGTAYAGSISDTVNNFDFSILGNLNIGCAVPGGTGCVYSNDGEIPDWTVVGGGGFQGGQITWGSPGNTEYPSGTPTPTTAYVSQGAIDQTLTDTAIGGATYTLSVLEGFPVGETEPNVPILYVGGFQAIVSTATTTPVQDSGTWVDFTGTYTVPTGQAGDALEIFLNEGGPSQLVQGQWTDVQLSHTLADSSSPEPATLTLLGAGLFGLALIGRKRI